jgi:hypothetical protein
VVQSNDPGEQVKTFHGAPCVLEYLLHHYIGDAVAPNAKTDATLNSGVEEAASVCVERDIKQFDALDDRKGEGSEKKE